MTNRYEANLLDFASKLDAMTEACGNITKLAKDIVDDSDDVAIRTIAQQISDITQKRRNTGRICPVWLAFNSNESVFRFWKLLLLWNTDIKNTIPE